eukprot:CAMPEP_0176504666 /NCGR_PEP_ID=MMETSP0200_2-20121128/16062_1 /TAXON_ID=947934 /ORGANISM="Chaetoceros sp., Strain GSL56" /LENGTH=466 /DNA_ID=CAMNT_0017904127 /DNA_START=267 /DNA_END=1667 /DNA_ORIENTATION=+
MTPLFSEKRTNAEGIVLKNAFDNDRASLLASAFDALADDEKYDAVLTGLCSKIINGKIEVDPQQIGKEATLKPSQLALEKLKDPLRLVEEMNQRKIKANSRSLMALIDAAGSTQDAKAMATVLSLALKNGSLLFYGSQQSSITPLPSSPTSFIPHMKLTRSQRLEKLPNVPVDNRAQEITSALLTLAVVGICLILQGFGNGLGLDEVTPYTSAILYSILGIGIVDNFFDGLKGISSFIIKMNSEKLPEAVKNAKGIEKDSMPFGLGSGAITGTVVRGLTRLWSVDTERECQCEAAAFFAAYSLGLPCFGFKPNALEAALLMFESARNEDESDRALDTLLSDSGLMKVLIWLMAPVAFESSLHPQLIASDPREARGFLQRLKEKAKVFGTEDEINTILRIEDGDAVTQQQQQQQQQQGKEIDDLLKWAFAEADLLLRSNEYTVNALSERLIGGAATLGDCTAVLEEW